MNAEGGEETVPADQRLRSDDLRPRQIDDRLVVEGQLVALDRLPQLALEMQRKPDTTGLDLGVVELELVTAAPLGLVHGDVRLGHELLGRFDLGRADRHPDAGARQHLPVAQADRLPEQLRDPLGGADGLVIALDVFEQDSELVAAQTRDRVALADEAP